MNNADIEIPRPERLETSFRIFVDQAGYLPTAEKTAVFTFPAGYYSVINETGSICFSGIPVPAGLTKPPAKRCSRRISAA